MILKIWTEVALIFTKKLKILPICFILIQIQALIYHWDFSFKSTITLFCYSWLCLTSQYTWHISEVIKYLLCVSLFGLRLQRLYTMFPVQGSLGWTPSSLSLPFFSGFLLAQLLPSDTALHQLGSSYYNIHACLPLFCFLLFNGTIVLANKNDCVKSRNHLIEYKI